MSDLTRQHRPIKSNRYCPPHLILVHCFVMQALAGTPLNCEGSPEPSHVKPPLPKRPVCSFSSPPCLTQWRLEKITPLLSKNQRLGLLSSGSRCDCAYRRRREFDLVEKFQLTKLELEVKNLINDNEAGKIFHNLDFVCYNCCSSPFSRNQVWR